MRFVRIPFYYLPDNQLKYMHRHTHVLLPIIHDIHNDIPNFYHWNKTARHFQYHPSFLIWSHDKSMEEILARGIAHKTPLEKKIRSLQSRRLSYFLPPTDKEIAEDVVYLLETWKKRLMKGGRKLPLSYVDLARSIYGYNPDKTSLERVAELSGYHRDNDSGWYSIQS